MTLTDVFPGDWIRSPEGVLWQVAWLDLPYLVCRPPTTEDWIDAHEPIVHVKIHADRLADFTPAPRPKRRFLNQYAKRRQP